MDWGNTELEFLMFVDKKQKNILKWNTEWGFLILGSALGCDEITESDLCRAMFEGSLGLEIIKQRIYATCSQCCWDFFTTLQDLHYFLHKIDTWGKSRT